MLQEETKMKINKKQALKKIKDAAKTVKPPKQYKTKCDKCECMWELHADDILEDGVFTSGKTGLGLITFRYFLCPRCEEQYITYAGNERSEQLINRRNSIRGAIKQLHSAKLFNHERYFQLLAEDNQAAEELKKISEACKKELKRIGEIE